MKIEIVLRETPNHIEDFFRDQKIEPRFPEDERTRALTGVEVWSQIGGVLIEKDEFNGEPCYRVTRDTDALIKFLRALKIWYQG